MCAIKRLEIPRINRLGLGNVEGIENSKNKSISIEYTSCEQKGILLNLRFKVESKNLDPNYKKAYLNVFRSDTSERNFGGSVMRIVEIPTNGNRAIEVGVPITFLQAFYEPNKYYRASISVISDKKEERFWALSYGFELKIKESDDVCYCLKQGLTNTSCKGNGKNIVDEMYINLATKLGVEKEIFLAIAKQESRYDPFILNKPKQANILLERHYVYNLLLKKYGRQKADYYKSIDSTLCHENITPPGQYGGRLHQIDRLKKVKEWDETIAIESCSWGKFQTMGEYIEEDKEQTYSSANDFEKAMNMCEVQHFKYFSFFIEKIKGQRLINAMKNKDWESIAKWYNGNNWKKTNPDYPKNIKKYYEEIKNY